MKKSLVLLLSLFLVTTTMLTACGGGTKAEEPPKTGDTPKQVEKADTSPFEVTLRHTQVGADKKNRLAILQDVVKKVQEETPGLTIKLDGVDSEVNRKEKLRGEMAAGNPPDIFDVFGSPDAQMYAKEGRMLDLTPILAELGIADKFPNVLDPYTVDGKVYGLPIGASAEGFFYNKEYFEKKGLKVPTTFPELEDLLAKIKADGKTPIAAASKEGWVPLMLTNQLWARYAGPDIVKKIAAGEAKWTDPNMVKAFAKHVDWEKKGYFKKGELGFAYGDITGQFTSGEAPLWFDGTWKSSVFKKGQSGEAMIGKVGFFNMPPVDGGVGEQTALMRDSNNGYGFSASVADDPRKLDAVKKFIKELFNEDMQLRGLAEDGVLPSMAVSEDKLNATVTDDLMKDITKVLSSTKGSFPAWDSQVAADINTEFSAVQIQKLIGGQTTPEKMAQDLQKVTDEVLANKE
ncbi:ABC transporter substrate-binding protein [Paenibacillus tuaregi]|uniref:ABC transporter substrate-binding protein n=1 Tax=Paenibacillus tuaregi TaxID=1816681 RepID=UPI000837C467|nr:extracellular solute-binding protein [Paenibacillus tuaregi]